jgi:pimeloyl-ACP methyl ester carboxylesterase
MKTVRSKDATMIAFDRVGEGPPLVMVDGALCSRAMGPGASLAPLLAEHFTVFTYDRRGRGDSRDTPSYAVEREIEDLQAVIDRAGGSAYVFGHSSGAVLALEAAARGGSISKLALYEPPFIVDDSRPPVPDDIVDQFNERLAAGRRGDAVKLFLQQVGAPGIVIALMRVTPMWSKLNAVAHTLPYDLSILRGVQRGEPLPAERWTGVTIATMVVVGEKSPAWLQNSTQALAHVLPNARLSVAAGQTHRVKPKLLAPQLTEFLTTAPHAPSPEPAAAAAVHTSR